MKLLTVHPQALLVQDLHDYLDIVRNAVRGIWDQIEGTGLSEQQVIEWVVKESIECVYHLLSVNHDSRDWRYSRFYDQLRNQIDLDHLTGQYIQVPLLYGDNCYIDLEIRGIDLFMWYFRHEQSSFANYSYERKWN